MEEQVSDIASSGHVDDDDDISEADSMQASSFKSKTIHSMVEKKRRDKMTQYVADLSTMIPMCGAMQRKLDKITVLRMAVQHLKAIKGSKVSQSNPEVAESSSLVSDNVVKALLETADCFLFVVACDRGKFLYVSESVTNFIQSPPTELIGQSIFDVLHPKDITKVKEQLVALDVTAREVFIDAKTMEPVDPGIVPKEELSVSSSGAARSFFCRMKTRLHPALQVKSEPDEGVRKKKPAHVYISLHCTGFLKTSASSKIAQSSDSTTDQVEMLSNLACLVAVAREAPRLTQSSLDAVGHINMKPVQFYARLDCDNKFSFVEPLVTYVTGYLPQEVIGSRVFEFFAEEDTNHLKELLKMATKTDEKIVSPVLSLQTVSNTQICVRVVLSVFRNPLTLEMEHTLLDITAVSSETRSAATPVLDTEPSRRLPTPDEGSLHESSIHSHSVSGEVDEQLTDEASRAVMMSFMGHDGGLGPQDSQNLDWPIN